MIDTTAGRPQYTIKAKAKPKLFKAPRKQNYRSKTGLAELDHLTMAERIKVSKGGAVNLQYLAQSLIDNILVHLSGNCVHNGMGRINRRFYEVIMPAYMRDLDFLSLNIPKVEHIKKENKSIDDLLTWNREVKFVLGQPSQALTELSLSCHDFKIFNPLNERLISKDSFPYLRKYSVGVFDVDKFPK